MKKTADKAEKEKKSQVVIMDQFCGFLRGLSEMRENKQPALHQYLLPCMGKIR
jgi:hypothetical protein